MPIQIIRDKGKPSQNQKTQKKDEKKSDSRTNWWNITFLSFITLSLVYTLFFRPEFGTTVNKEVSLPQIVANYASGVYEEILISGNEIEAKYRPIEAIENGQRVMKKITDSSLIPAGTKITDLGLSNPQNPTKVIIKDQKWGNLILEVLPSLLSTLLFIGLLFFLMTRVSIG
jgi:hypothetical protein